MLHDYNRAIEILRDAILEQYKFGEYKEFDELGLPEEYREFYFFGNYLFAEYERIENENYCTHYSQFK